VTRVSRFDAIAPISWVRLERSRGY
jgi:hypothetical protein